MRNVMAIVVALALVAGLLNVVDASPANAEVMAPATAVGLGGEPHEAAVDPVAREAWISVPALNRVQRVDLDSMQIVGGFDVVAPYGVDLGLNGSDVYVALRGSTGFATYDRGTGAVTQTVVPELGDSRTHDVFEAQSGILLVTSSPSSNGFAYVARHDLATGTSQRVANGRIIRATPTIVGDRSSVSFVSEGFSPNSLYKLDLAEADAPIVAEDDHGSVGGTWATALSPDGSFVVTGAGQILDASSATLVQRGLVTVGMPVVSADSETIYVAVTEDDVVRVVAHDADTALVTEEWFADCGDVTPLRDFVALSDAGSFLVAGGESACVIDTTDTSGSTTTSSVSSTTTTPTTSTVDTDGVHATAIGMGGDPWEAAVDPATRTAWITVPDANRVQRVDLDAKTIVGGFDVVSPIGIDIGAEGDVFVALRGATGFARFRPSDGSTTQTVVPELGHANTHDVFEALPGILLITSNPGSSGLAYVARHDLASGTSDRVAGGRIIRGGPTIIGDRSGVAYVSEGFSPNSLYELDLLQGEWPIVAEDDHGAVSGTWTTALSADTTFLVTGAGQILDATTEDFVQRGVVTAGIPVISGDGETIFTATADGGEITIVAHSSRSGLPGETWTAECGGGTSLFDFVALPDGDAFLALTDSVACIIETAGPASGPTTSTTTNPSTSTTSVPTSPTSTVVSSPTTAPPSEVAAPTPELGPGGSFMDDDGSVFEGVIEAIAARGITTGCTLDRFCPDDVVTRGQMAAFLARALDLSDRDPSFDFADADSSVFEADIERVATAGITLGCAPDRYCPEDPVTRGQMAAFLVRALGLSDRDPALDFRDADASVFETDIEKLAAAGITGGCAPELYCPEDPVTRGQMAAFLARALGLSVPAVPQR